jgi:uncharacterized membrane protein YdbT with pleckstrin-like domain
MMYLIMAGALIVIIVSTIWGVLTDNKIPMYISAAMVALLIATCIVLFIGWLIAKGIATL